MQALPYLNLKPNNFFIFSIPPGYQSRAFRYQRILILIRISLHYVLAYVLFRYEYRHGVSIEKVKLIVDNTNGIQMYADETPLSREDARKSISSDLEDENFIFAKDIESFLFNVDSLTDDEILCFYATDEEVEKIKKTHSVH